MPIPIALALVAAPLQVPDLPREFLSAPWIESNVLTLDFDGDGFEDIVYSGEEPLAPGLRLVVHWGLGGGDFEDRAEIQTDVALWRNLVVHDFDGDGDDDLVAQEEDTFDLVVLVNEGGRAAPPVLPFAQPASNVQSLELLDFDGDGDLDLITERDPSFSSDHEYWYLERLGPTSFGAPVSMFPAGERSPVAVFPDLNGDGLPDAITTDRVGNRVQVFRWDNAGGFPFGGKSLVEVGQPFASVNRFSVHDVDGDGDDDVVFQSTASGVDDSITLFRNQGGVLSPREQEVSIPEGVRAIELYDATGGGGRDLVMHDFDGRLVVVPDQGGGTYTTSTTLVQGFVRGAGGTLGDVDGDGRIDLVRLVSRDDGGRSVDELLLNRNAGTPGVPFTFAPRETLELALASPEGVDVADFNGDGYPDVVVAARAGTNVGLFENDGAGGFRPLRGILQNEPDAFELTHGDLDGDGDEDVVLTARDRLVWIENDAGATSWTERPIFSNGNRIGYGVAAVDLDGDGDLDVLHASERFQNGQNRIAMFENDGAGGFTGPTILVAPPRPQQVRCFETADLDGNGTLDLVFAANESTTARLVWAPQLVGGGFGAIVVLDAWTISSQSQSGYWDIVADDIDGDGDVDVIGSTVSQPSRLLQLTNDGTGTFTASDIDVFTGSTGTLDIEFVDVDLDGVGDLAATARPIGGVFASELVVYPGLGGGQFGPAESTDSGVDFAPHLRTADFDRDGDPDFATIFWSYDRVSVHRNQHGQVVSEPYCGPAVVNSTGRSAALVVAGSPTLADNAATLRAFDLPRFSPGFFLTSRTAGLNTMVPNSVGTLCLGGTIGRYAAPPQIQNSGASGTFSLGIDLTMIPQATGFAAAVAGEDWRFQAWYRDSSPSGATSNFTDGVRASWD